MKNEASFWQKDRLNLRLATSIFAEFLSTDDLLSRVIEWRVLLSRRLHRALFVLNVKAESHSLAHLLEASCIKKDEEGRA